MTLVVNLYGGPGTGKSTTAARLFADLKEAGVNAELVTEYAKDWAWQGRRIGPCDQFYMFGKQLHRESRLYGKVSVLVTDSPIGLAAFYAEHYSSEGCADALLRAHAAVRGMALAQYLDVFLMRRKAYNPAGRYETEAQAVDIDGKICAFAPRAGIVLRTVDPLDCDLLQIVQGELAC